MSNREHYNPWLLLEADVQDERPVFSRKNKPSKPAREQSHSADAQETAEPEEVEEFNFTYHASRHERGWINSALQDFYKDSIITDVLQLVRGGKEATVYCCTANPSLELELVAAKIYRPRIFRNLKNDALYKQGRTVLGEDGKPVRDARSQRAIQKKTRAGSRMQITSWIEHEYLALQTLFAAGANVPRPVAQSGNAILMEYIGDFAQPAPTLNGIVLPQPEAKSLFDLLIHNIRLMLERNYVHADLSAYNILYWEGKVTIIDFPQIVDPLYNPQGYDLLRRDVERICQYFQRYRISADPNLLATDLWGRYLRGELSND